MVGEGIMLVAAVAIGGWLTSTVLILILSSVFPKVNWENNIYGPLLTIAFAILYAVIVF